VRVARAIGWVFVAAIGYHALLAANDARRAGADGSWPKVLGYGAIAVAAAMLVIGACAHSVQEARRRAR
jgi:hypothetical protein